MGRPVTPSPDQPEVTPPIWERDSSGELVLTPEARFGVAMAHLRMEEEKVAKLTKRLHTVERENERLIDDYNLMRANWKERQYKDGLVIAAITQQRDRYAAVVETAKDWRWSATLTRHQATLNLRAALAALEENDE